MRTLLACLLAVAAASLVGAAAASLGGLGSSRLAAGAAPVVACDTNGVTLAYSTSGGNVTSVTVGGLADPGCEGGGLKLTLATATDVALGSGTATVPTDAGTTDNSVVVSISPTVAAAAVARAHVSVTGP